VCFFGFAFRTNGVGFFTEAKRNHFKLLFAFIAFKFVNRHICAILAFYFNLKIKKENVNASGMFRPELFIQHAVKPRLSGRGYKACTVSFFT
jgi:hypothetical protein